MLFNHINNDTIVFILPCSCRYISCIPSLVISMQIYSSLNFPIYLSLALNDGLLLVSQTSECSPTH